MKIVRANKQQLAIEILTVLSTVFGAWVVTSYLIIRTVGIEYTGSTFLYLKLSVLGAWYVIPAILISIAIPSESKFRLLALSTIITTLLLVTAGMEVNSELNLTTRILAWLEMTADKIIVIPIFAIVGHFLRKD